MNLETGGLDVDDSDDIPVFYMNTFMFICIFVHMYKYIHKCVYI